MLWLVTATLGIAVVHYRTPDLALACLDRLHVAAPSAQVVLVDTAPEPAFERHLATRHPAVRFLRAPNHSYSRSVNIGVAALNSEYVALMNADVLVQPDTFRQLLEVLGDHPGGAVAAPLALAPDGTPQRMGLPYALNYRRLRAVSARAARAAEPAASTASRTTAVQVSWLGGYLQCMPRELWERVGGYDETFRFFNEDIDFSYRVREQGGCCLLVDAPVEHLGGSATPEHPAFHVEGRRGGMIVSARHHGKAFRWAHAAYLWVEAQLGRRLARSEASRAAHAAVLEMLESGDWNRSPFGATLDERR